MVTENGNDRESREGFSSSEENKNGNEPVKKKRVRVGDLRKQAYDTPERGSRERNPYRSNDDRQSGSSYNDRPSRQSYGYDGGDDRRSYNDNRSGGNRGGYGNRDGYSGGDGRSSYGNRDNDRRSGGGYQQRQGGGYQQRGGGGGYQQRQSDGGGYQQRGGGGGYQQRGGGGGYQQRGGGRPNDGIKRLVKPVKYKENIDPNTPLRLNKYLANAGVCSRREADAYITSGVVKVNGVVVDQLGAKVTRGDLVTFQDQPVRLESKVYVLLNKPKNCVTTSDDPQNRLTVMDLVKNACPERIYPVGRLDRNTTGVLLLTNDGDLASKLMHPKFKKKKIYQVTLDRDVAIEDMQAIADGIELDDGEIHADSIAYQAEDVLNVVGIEIHSGRNRIVRRIFEKLGYQVVKLDRVYFAGLTKKNVLRGKWRYLTEKEVNMLRMGAFE
ncbi:23S rRNA pseudouridine2605 synthase [Dysgonomonas sp. PFB1-18]|uniref:pseudouridine synthase n=1 Tax=unclassified Dysgonomonas TaxID=2630389 RepID=UPI0024757E24|nr:MULTISPECIES: pseudouridine synthase [unclassified Dysgonomonas]MDL2302981.1 RNA-binding S4 domain-containing protein [Dysgonomonas sp. OttesenSCG-928-D17]MDH6308229.1 23S rRNA pseudouridine2605 synthase [Dysgonomonas sp. PF1-14]MDH6338332.1 23S rRNA pseudouridine2605 synthase [Dysgonomonas sp. PF1-16]MDH6379829.1 23S rRNA pseudouridine2605 synthase [Dysgonomonas sp. PFB1-18]MDH6397081.1 23S rRNA pseudouridine2605 synthase [Dysgonomonas sp. PF1-23]